MSLPSGENSIILTPGANGKFSKQLPKSWYKAVKECDVLLMQREIPEWVNLEFAKHAKFSILDCGGDSRKMISLDLMKNCSVVTPNQTEMLSIFKKEVVDKALQSDDLLVKKMKEKGLKSILLKEGSKGSTMLELVDGKI